MPRVKPHFKVHTSLANHRKMAAVYSDNRLLALWTRLGMAGVERFADRTGDSFIVSARELPSLTGTKRSDSAEKLLKNLVNTSPILAEFLGTTWRITFPNFAKKQGFGLRKGARTGHSPSPSPTPAPTPPCPPLGGTVRAVWSECQKAAAAHGKLWRSLTKQRLAMMGARLADLETPEPRRLVDAIEGAAILSGGREGWRNYLTPETIYRPSKFTKYLEAFDQQRAERLSDERGKPEIIDADDRTVTSGWDKPLEGDG